MDFCHETVLAKETVDALNLNAGDTAIDCTAGGGGHVKGLLDRVMPGGKVLAIDRDREALEHLSQRFKEQVSQGDVELIHEPFSNLLGVVQKRDLMGKVAGICADLGVSSHQINQAKRGFSFDRDGPLDMRMDANDESASASDLVNTMGEKDLAKLIWDFGEEPKARLIARKICLARSISSISTTKQLTDIIKNSGAYAKHSKKNPATKTFQALRIAVNNELGELNTLLVSLPKIFRPGGRIAIISFHSLEDRAVKQRMKMLSGQSSDRSWVNRLPFAENIASQGKVGKIVRPFPIKPSEDEIHRNPRSRSAHLRAFEFDKSLI